MSIGQSCASSSLGSEYLFAFFETLANGTHPLIPPVLDQQTGLCYYPTADCESGPCCVPSSGVSAGQSTSTAIVNYASMMVYFGCIAGVQRWLNKLRSGADDAPDAGPPRPPSGLPECLNQMGIYLGVIATTFVTIVMADSTQLALPVPQRNSMLAAVAFLTPVKDVFQFLEDTTTVKITFAMGSGNYASIRAIARVGIGGGLLAGVFGALLMSVLAAWPSAIEFLLAPGAAQAQLENPGCSLLPSAAEVVDTARGLWLLTCWAWPFQFCAMVLTGLLMGAREFGLFGLVAICSQLTMVLTWFLGPKPQNLDLLGLSTFMSSLVLCIGLALAIYWNRPLRRKYGLLHDESSSLAGFDTGGDTQKTALVDGFLAMTLDLVLQAAGTIAVFVAGFLSLQDMYQLSAAGAALPQYTAYATGLGYIIKLAGSALVGHGAYSAFAKLIWMMVALSVVLGVIAGAAILPYTTVLAAFYGAQACEFASKRECLGVYSGLFGDGVGMVSESHTIFNTFTAFGVAAMFTCVFSVVKAGLYACQDFAFMAKASLATFVCVFLPALLIARLYFASATALFVASVLPTWILTGRFLLRLRENLRQMMQGRPGPWMRTSSPPLAASDRSGAAVNMVER